MAQDFVIYRPPLPAHRLENKYAAERPEVWRPSHSYKQKLSDIQLQLTPAETFRHRLATSGKLIRLIQRLELRINRNIDRFIWASIKIQALIRGLLGRRYFHQVKDDLKVSLDLRRNTQAAVDAFKTKSFVECIRYCRQCSTRNESICLMELKAHYYLSEYEDAIQCSLELKRLNQAVEDLYYIQACSWSQVGRHDEAVRVLDEAYVYIPRTSSRFLRLYGYICLQLTPPKFDSAIESYSEVIKRDSKDLEAHLERASCYCCLQEYSLALKDLKVILAFRPDHHAARLRRARLFACMRDWKAAKADYTFLLGSPQHQQEATVRLQEIEIANINALAEK